MYKVNFGAENLFNSANDIEAIQFAVALHQSSNVPHSIKVVIDPQDDTVVPEDWKLVLTLIKQ